jgi:hypothetical protein
MPRREQLKGLNPGNLGGNVAPQSARGLLSFRVDELPPSSSCVVQNTLLSSEVYQATQHYILEQNILHSDGLQKNKPDTRKSRGK